MFVCLYVCLSICLSVYIYVHLIFRERKCDSRNANKLCLPSPNSIVTYVNAVQTETERKECTAEGCFGPYVCQGPCVGMREREMERVRETEKDKYRETITERERQNR